MIWIILSGFYPTHKAYGVTTSGTIEALTKLKCDVTCVSRNDINELLTKNSHVGRYFVEFSNTLLAARHISKFYFPIWQIVVSRFALKLLSDAEGTIWVREPLLALIFSFTTKKKIICEVHHSKGIVTHQLIQMLAKRPLVTLAPIKMQIAIDCKLTISKTPIAFMAVNNNFLERGRTRSSSREIQPKIVVVANSSNKFQRESLSRLIEQIGVCAEGSKDWEFTFAGIDASMLSQLPQRNQQYVRFKVLGRVSHDRILDLLEVSDIGIIPYLDNEYFLETFPIKAVEYAATKNLIIASDTRSHRKLLNDKAILYDLWNNAGLYKAISAAISRRVNTKNLLDEAYSWASDHSFQARVINVLKVARSKSKFDD